MCFDQNPQKQSDPPKCSIGISACTFSKFSFEIPCCFDTTGTYGAFICLPVDQSNQNHQNYNNCPP